MLEVAGAPLKSDDLQNRHVFNFRDRKWMWSVLMGICMEKKKRIGSNHQCPSWITDPKSMKLQHVATNPCPPLFPTPNPWLRKVRWNFHSGWDSTHKSLHCRIPSCARSLLASLEHHLVDQLGVFSLFHQICRGVSVWPETSLALQAAWPTCFFYIAASTRLNPFKSIQFLPFFRTNRSTLQLYVVAGCCRWWRKTFYRIHPNTMELSTFPHGKTWIVNGCSTYIGPVNVVIQVGFSYGQLFVNLTMTKSL